LNLGAVVWMAWLAVAVWLTGRGLASQVAYFRSPGPQFFRLLIIALAVFPLALAAYQRLRRARFWQWELALIAAIPLGAALLYQPAAAAVTLAAVLASYALGRRLCHWFSIPTSGAVEDITISVGLGLGALHCALFILGLGGWYAAPAFIAWIAFCLLVGWREYLAFWMALVRLHHAWGATLELQGWAGAIITVFGIAFGICSVMVMLAPSVAFDMVRVHLPLVHYYACLHALRTPSYINYGYFPQGIETLMTFGYMLAGDAAAQMLPVVYFVLALATALRIGRMCGLSVFPAIAGTLFAVATPLLHWTGSVGKNDLALAFFILAALHGYLGWRESGEFRCVLAGAFFLAMGAGVKHSVLYAIPPLALLYAHAALRHRSPVQAIAKLALIFLLFGTFWHARTWVLTGNPLYPFSAEAAVSTAGKAHGAWNIVLRSLRLAWDIHFHGRAYFESPLDHPMGIVLVLFLPLWALARQRVNRAEAVCLFFCGLYLAYWAVVHGVPRFAIAPILILNVLTARRLIHFCWQQRPLVRFSVYAASAYALLFGLLGVAIVEINAPQFRYFAGRIDNPGYLRQAMVPYRALEFLRGAVHTGDTVFSLSSCLLAYAPDPSAFYCTWPSESAPGRAMAALGQRDYRFLMLPVAYSVLVPPGWKMAYADESFQIYQRDPRP
jgi:hypothetical protein